MTGYIHSIESFGTVDGPGIRFVVFLQGCPLRCKYCHNPDTWIPNKEKPITVEEILEKYNSCKEFLRGGGITVTGGEPLMQIDFVTELFKTCNQKGIHTCLDTSGITFTSETRAKFDELMKYTDLVMLDIKHIDNEEHIKLTGKSNVNILNFAKYLYEINKTMWIRHVVVPNITLNDKYLFELGYFLADLKNIKALDVLPYHSMGNVKYEQLGMVPPLKETLDLTKEEASVARDKIVQGIKQKLHDNKIGKM